MRRLNFETFRRVRKLVPVIVVLILVATTAASAQTIQWLQNDSYTGGTVSCEMGIGDGESIAARFTAPPDAYPYSIDRIRVLCCGPSVGLCSFTIWQDNGALNPGTALYYSLDAFQIGGAQTPTFYDIVMPPGVPVITSGTIRVSLEVFLQSTGFGVDLDGIIPQQNLVRNNVAVWSFAENAGIHGDWIMRLGIIGPPTSIGDESIPREFALAANVPNPFNPVTTIRYDVPAGGANVNIAILDVTGRIVHTLVNERREAGRFDVQWNGVSARGEHVASGVYFYRMRAGGFVQTRKMVLLK